ncbi:MAG: D-amino-acid transaminase [Sphingomonadales bacterium]|nr:D-amino-acid transaminase [Sphingomonadales bacterium]
MSRIAYVDGRYVPHREASVHIEDRGYQFADGVYEVCAVMNGRLLDEAPHLDRLDRSLRELRIPQPMTRPALLRVLREVVRRNRVRQGLVYMQVTRGVARRDHPFPAHARPVLVVAAKHVNFAKTAARAAAGVKVITVPDQRWARCDIKSVALLPNILAKQAAVEAGAFEAWQVDEDGYVTEGSSTNAWIVTKDGVLVTRQLGNEILPGITRAAILAIAKTSNLKVEERPFTVAEAKSAREAFVTSATSFAMPVIEIDGQAIANGAPGSIARMLFAAYWDKAKIETGVDPDLILGSTFR